MSNISSIFFTTWINNNILPKKVSLALLTVGRIMILTIVMMMEIIGIMITLVMMAIVVLIMTTMMIYLVPDVLMSSIQTAGSPALVPFNIQQRALEHSF